MKKLNVRKSRLVELNRDQLQGIANGTTTLSALIPTCKGTSVGLPSANCIMGAFGAGHFGFDARPHAVQSL